MVAHVHRTGPVEGVAAAFGEAHVFFSDLDALHVLSGQLEWILEMRDAQVNDHFDPKILIESFAGRQCVLDVHEIMMHLVGPLLWGIDDGLQDGPFGAKRMRFEPRHHHPHRFWPASPTTIIDQREWAVAENPLISPAPYPKAMTASSSAMVAFCSPARVTRWPALRLVMASNYAKSFAFRSAYKLGSPLYMIGLGIPSRLSHLFPPFPGAPHSSNHALHGILELALPPSHDSMVCCAAKIGVKAWVIASGVAMTLQNAEECMKSLWLWRNI